jgi:hypothetical protein
MILSGPSARYSGSAFFADRRLSPRSASRFERARLGCNRRADSRRLSQSRSRRRNVDVRTTNRLDGRVTKPFARNRKKAKQLGLVSVTEKTSRISGISGGHAGSRALGKLDAHIDRRRHDRCRNLVVHADYGDGNPIRGHGESHRGDRMAGRSADRQCLQMPSPGTRQGVVRGRDRDGGDRRAIKTLIGKSVRGPATAIGQAVATSADSKSPG